MTGGEGAQDRHRSKFNKGKKNKKAKNKRKKTNKIRRGSEEELQSVVTIMKNACVYSGYSQTISETCQFLLVWDYVDLSKELFDCYNTMCDAIHKSQRDRIEKTKNEKFEIERQLRKDGENNINDNHLLLVLPVEKEVDALSCPTLEPSLIEIFSLP